MAKPRVNEEQDPQTQLLPVMNIMLLLIPALLLAMEVARMGAIEVLPPTTSAKPGGEDPPKPVDRLHVFIGSDGFELSVGKRDGERTRIPVLDPARAPEDPERYDFAGLEAHAKSLTELAVLDPVVLLDAEGDVSMATLVAAMDALRGSACRMGQTRPGENPPRDCLFWNVVVEPGARAG
jgi:biopolymer transport protein ExbD